MSPYVAQRPRCPNIIAGRFGLGGRAVRNQRGRASGAVRASPPIPSPEGARGRRPPFVKSRPWRTMYVDIDLLIVRYRAAIAAN